MQARRMCTTDIAAATLASINIFSSGDQKREGDKGSSTMHKIAVLLPLLDHRLWTSLSNLLAAVYGQRKHMYIYECIFYFDIASSA